MISNDFSYSRSNEISGNAIDEQLPHSWIVENLIIHKDMSVASGFSIDLPPFFCMDERGQENFHQQFSNFLNSLEEKFHVQVVWEVHRETNDIIDAIEKKWPENRLMQAYQSETIERIRESAKQQRLRRYRAYIVLVHEPLYNRSHFTNRGARIRKERKKEGIWRERYSISDFLLDLFGLNAPPPYALNYSNDEWTAIKRGMAGGLASLSATLTNIGLNPQYLYEQDLVNILYSWWNPTLAESGSPAPEFSAEPRAVGDYVIQSPLSMDRKRGYLYMDNAVHRILTLRTPPSDLKVNTFDGLLDGGQVPNLRVICNIVPYDTMKRIRELEKRLPMIEARARTERRMTVVAAQIQRQIISLQNGEESSWGMTMTFHTWAKDEEAVDQQTLDIKRIARGCGNASVVQEEHALWRYWMATQPFWTRDADIHRRHLYSTAELCCLIPLSGHPEQFDGDAHIPVETANSSLFNFNPFDSKRLDNFNILISGTSGTGKTCLAVSIALGLQREKPRVIVVDLGKPHVPGGYSTICEALEGEYVTFSPSSKNQTTNPLYLNPMRRDPKEVISAEERNQIVHWLESALLEEHEHLDRKTKSELDEVIYKLYLNAGGKELFLGDLRTALQSYGENSGTSNVLTMKDLAIRLNIWCQGGQYGSLFDGRTKLDFSKSFTVFDMRAARDNKDIAPLMIMSVMNNVREMAANYPHEPKMLIMDEAWFLLENPASAKFVEECFRTFRALNISIIGLSQGVTEWLVNDNASAILQNANTKFILNQSNPEALKDTQQLLGLTSDECDIIANLKKVPGQFAQALMLQKRQDGRFSTVVLNRTTPLQYAIMTTSPADRAEIDKIRDEGGLTALEARLEFAKRFPRGTQG